MKSSKAMLSKLLVFALAGCGPPEPPNPMDYGPKPWDPVPRPSGCGCATSAYGQDRKAKEEDPATVAGVDFSKFPVWPPLQRKSRSRVVETSQSLAEAVEKAEPSDTLLLADGKHVLTGEIVVAKSIWIRSESGKATLVPASAEVRQALVLRADDLWIDGLTIEGFEGMPVQVGRTDGTTQRNVILSNLVIRGGEDGIRSAPIGKAGKPQISGLLVRDVRIENARLVGFNIGEGPATDIRLEHVTVTMKGGADGNSGADAIAIENGDNVFVNRCEVTGASGDGLDFKATRVAVFNSTVHDLGRNGVKFWKGGDLVNTLIYNTGADASVVFEGGGTYRVLHTIVALHVPAGGAYAMTVGYGNTEPIQLTIANSIFWKNGGSLWVSSATKLAVHNSLFTGSASGYEIAIQKKPDEEEYVTKEEGWPKDARFQGNLPLGTDPRFENPGKGDFRLRQDSPAVDAGLSKLPSYPSADRQGGRRIKGRGPDLGPDESR